MLLTHPFNVFFGNFLIWEVAFCSDKETPIFVEKSSSKDNHLRLVSCPRLPHLGDYGKGEENGAGKERLSSITLVSAFILKGSPHHTKTATTMVVEFLDDETLPSALHCGALRR